MFCCRVFCVNPERCRKYPLWRSIFIIDCYKTFLVYNGSKLRYVAFRIFNAPSPPSMNSIFIYRVSHHFTLFRVLLYNPFSLIFVPFHFWQSYVIGPHIEGIIQSRTILSFRTRSAFSEQFPHVRTFRIHMLIPSIVTIRSLKFLNSCILQLCGKDNIFMRS